MPDPLQLLSFQTFSNAEYTENRDPDMYQTPIAKTVYQPTIAPNHLEERALRPDNFQAQPTTFRPSFQPALKTAKNKDKLYLAEACGNCARAYGTPLVCALVTEPIEPLSCCDLYLSPFNLPAA